MLSAFLVLAHSGPLRLPFRLLNALLANARSYCSLSVLRNAMVPVSPVLVYALVRLLAAFSLFKALTQHPHVRSAPAALSVLVLARALRSVGLVAAFGGFDTL